MAKEQQQTDPKKKDLPGAPASLCERTACGAHKDGTFYIRATDGEDAKAIQDAAAKHGISLEHREDTATHHGRKGVYPHFHTNDPDHLAKIMDELKNTASPDSAAAMTEKPGSAGQQGDNPGDTPGSTGEARKEGKAADTEAQAEEPGQSGGDTHIHIHMHEDGSGDGAGDEPEQRRRPGRGIVKAHVGDHTRTLNGKLVQVHGYDLPEHLQGALKQTAYLQKMHGWKNPHAGTAWKETLEGDHKNAQESHEIAAGWHSAEAKKAQAEGHTDGRVEGHEGAMKAHDAVAKWHGEQLAAADEGHMLHEDQDIHEGEVLAGRAKPRDYGDHYMLADSLSRRAEKENTPEAHMAARDAHGDALKAAHAAAQADSGRTFVRPPEKVEKLHTNAIAHHHGRAKSLEAERATARAEDLSQAAEERSATAQDGPAHEEAAEAHGRAKTAHEKAAHVHGDAQGVHERMGGAEAVQHHISKGIYHLDKADEHHAKRDKHTELAHQVTLHEAIRDAEKKEGPKPLKDTEAEYGKAAEAAYAHTKGLELGGGTLPTAEAHFAAHEAHSHAAETARAHAENLAGSAAGDPSQGKDRDREAKGYHEAADRHQKAADWHNYLGEAKVRAREKGAKGRKVAKSLDAYMAKTDLLAATQKWHSARWDAANLTKPVEDHPGLPDVVAGAFDALEAGMGNEDILAIVKQATGSSVAHYGAVEKILRGSLR
jgi:hypothetical protein